MQEQLCVFLLPIILLQEGKPHSYRFRKNERTPYQKSGYRFTKSGCRNRISENEGFPPLKIKEENYGDQVDVPANISSQFITSLL
jgi:5-enolpyruvylshikimate-3-phosphate synthase